MSLFDLSYMLLLLVPFIWISALLNGYLKVTPFVFAGLVKVVYTILISHCQALYFANTWPYGSRAVLTSLSRL